MIFPDFSEIIECVFDYELFLIYSEVKFSGTNQNYWNHFFWRGLSM